MGNRLSYRDEDPELKETLNAIKWALGYLLIGLGFTLPIWGAMLGLY